MGTTLFESQPSGIEIAGLIAYNSGWDGPDRSHGPGFYIRNRSDWPTKLIRDNIVFQHYRQALQGYGSFNNVFSNFLVEGNVLFNNGIGADVTCPLKTNLNLERESKDSGVCKEAGNDEEAIHERTDYPQAEGSRS